MSGRLISFAGLLLLAGAVVLATPGWGHAQHGGGHFGSAHFGGAHFGGYHSGGFYHGGYSHPYYYHRYYDHPYIGDYGYHNYYPYLYNTYPYVWSSPSSYPSYYSSSGEAEPPSSDYYEAAPPAGNSEVSTRPADLDTRAHITVRVPEGAKVWFDGTLTTSTGPVREFQSPPLTPGKQFSYEARAIWNDGGHEVKQTQSVKVTPGAYVDVDFPRAGAISDQTLQRRAQ
jgi:uncharacterized protein (TIGR03000 family)